MSEFKWEGAVQIFEESDFSICWGKFNKEDNEKSLGVGYKNFPHLKDNRIAYIVIPDYLVQGILGTLLKYMTENEYSPDDIKEISNVLIELNT